MENNETIGGKILSLRKAKGYTQEQKEKAYQTLFRDVISN